MGYSCVLPVDEGEACFNDEDCQQGLTCNWAYTPHRCALPEGEGGMCLYTKDCMEGFICQWVDGDKLCVAAEVSVGDPCRSHNDCGHQLVCNMYFDQCREPALEGEVCGSGSCIADLVCNHGYDPPVCVERDSSEAGDPCWKDLHCTPGLICEDAACRSPNFKTAGEHCDRDLECNHGLRCGYP